MKKQGTKSIVRVSISFVFCAAIVFSGFQGFGEDLTAEQKEVWEQVIADWELLKQGDIKGVMAIRHENAMIWWPDKMFPFVGQSMQRQYENWIFYNKPIAYKLEPPDIQIYGNVAVVAYENSWNSDRMSGHGRAMETWIRQNNQWLKISSFSASCDKLPRCK